MIKGAPGHQQPCYLPSASRIFQFQYPNTYKYLIQYHLCLVIINTKKLPIVESREMVKPGSDNLNKSNLQCTSQKIGFITFVFSNILPVSNNGNHLYIHIEINTLYMYNVW